MSEQVTAVILAAGIGERFWPMIGNKVLFPFFGKTFFDWAIRDALPKEVERVIIVADSGHVSVFQSLDLGKPTTVVIQKEPGSMADAMLTAAPQLHGAPLLVIIADDLLEPNFYTQVIEQAKKHQVFGIIPVRVASDAYFPGGYLSIQGTRATSITEKPVRGKEPNKLAVISGHFIANSDIFLEVLKRVPRGDSAYEQALDALMREHEFTFVTYEEKFSSLKYPWHVLDVMDQLLERTERRVGKHVEIGDGVVIKGNVTIEDNARIFDHTTIIGPTYIGKNVIVGSNNLIRRSHIGEGSVTGFNTDITRSYVGDNCWFHRNYVGDSVLAHNVSMGSGTVIANLRLDEGAVTSVVKREKIDTERTKLGAMIGPNVRIGVSTSIMPGVKIGRDTFVGAGVILDKDLPEGSFCSAKSIYRVTKNSRSLARKDRGNFKKLLE